MQIGSKSQCTDRLIVGSSHPFRFQIGLFFVRLISGSVRVVAIGMAVVDGRSCAMESKTGVTRPQIARVLEGDEMCRILEAGPPGEAILAILFRAHPPLLSTIAFFFPNDSFGWWTPLFNKRR